MPDPTWRTTADWPTAGYGYLKWLWNHFMPGVTAADVAPGGVALPASATMPDVVFSDQEAVDPTTWSTGQQDPYRFGIIKYAQTSWLNYSPGPMLAYTENYWFGENHYMPGPGSAIAPDLKATINNVQMPVLNPPPPASNNIPSGQTTVTFNQPVDANGAAIGTAAQGYAIMGQGSIDLTAMGNYTKALFGGSGIGAGYSSGAWVTNGGSGYTSADVGAPHNLNVIFTPQAGDTPSRPAKGYIDTVSQGQVVSITITDPGHGYTKEPLISFPTTLAGTGAEAVALVLESDGYPTLTFHATGTKQAHGFVTVGSQGNKPGGITGVTIFDPGRGYAYAPIDTTAANPLAGPDGLKITFSSTTAPPQYLPQILHKAGVPAAQAAPPLFVPVNSSPQMVDQIVITVLGDHYDTGRNKPYYTLGGDPSNTKHHLAGGVAKNGVAPTYNAAYVPALNAVGAFVVDDSGIAQITVINPGSGYPAGAIITSGGAGYDNSTTYNIAFPAPL
ncbi:MAG: hypothetical protein FJ275_14470, partial [Planctomycetes bacterium]|nr:hypothetical protein [Planctomycetota bacterium]